MSTATAIQPPPPLSEVEALKEEVQTLKQRIVRLKQGHQKQIQELYDENQMLIQDLLKAEAELDAFKQSAVTAQNNGIALESKPGALPKDVRVSAGLDTKVAEKSNVDPLIRLGGTVKVCSLHLLKFTMCVVVLSLIVLKKHV